MWFEGTRNAVVDRRRHRAFVFTEEFRPLLLSQGTFHAVVLIAEAEPSLDRFGVPHPLAPIGTCFEVVSGGKLVQSFVHCVNSGGTPFPLCFAILGKTEDEIGRFRGLSTGGEDKTRIVFHRSEPTFHVGNVIAQVVAGWHSKLTAEIARSDFGDEFTEGVGVFLLLAIPTESSL